MRQITRVQGLALQEALKNGQGGSGAGEEAGAPGVLIGVVVQRLVRRVEQPCFMPPRRQGRLQRAHGSTAARGLRGSWADLLGFKGRQTRFEFADFQELAVLPGARAPLWHRTWCVFLVS